MTDKPYIRVTYEELKKDMVAALTDLLTDARLYPESRCLHEDQDVDKAAWSVANDLLAGMPDYEEEAEHPDLPRERD